MNYVVVNWNFVHLNKKIQNWNDRLPQSMSANCFVLQISRGLFCVGVFTCLLFSTAFTVQQGGVAFWVPAATSLIHGTTITTHLMPRSGLFKKREGAGRSRETGQRSRREAVREAGGSKSEEGLFLTQPIKSLRSIHSIRRWPQGTDESLMEQVTH